MCLSFTAYFQALHRPPNPPWRNRIYRHSETTPAFYLRALAKWLMKQSRWIRQLLSTWPPTRLPPSPKSFTAVTPATQLPSTARPLSYSRRENENFDYETDQHWRGALTTDDASKSTTALLCLTLFPMFHVETAMFQIKNNKTQAMKHLLPPIILQINIYWLRFSLSECP